MTNWLDLTIKEQIELFSQIGAKTGMQPLAIEKDAWVTLVLRILFRSEIKNHIVFKGGTSLSKAYGLIERFSEDIDFSINREFLGFPGKLTKGQIRKLRRASHKFSAETLPEILRREFQVYGINNNLFDIEVPNIKISDQDPEVLHINYFSVFEETEYLKSRILIEIGARSLIEPFENKSIRSIIDEHYPNSEFAESRFEVRTAIPEKTFLEKLILLHEEFQKESDKRRYHRMSRHLYDIYQIIRTDYGINAINDKALFDRICMHRENLTPVKRVNYNGLTVRNLNFTPPVELIDFYRKDYNEMRNTMIYGDSVDFDKMIESIKEILPDVNKSGI